MINRAGPEGDRPFPPPRFARWLLAVLLPERDREIHLADLDELHALKAGRRGRRAAGRWYWRQVWASGVRMARRPGEGEMMGSMGLLVRHSFRSLRRAPAFTGTAVVTLALGIGATVAVFSVVNGVLLQALPYPDADRLVVIYTDSPPNRWNLSVADYITLDERQTVLEDFGARTLRRMTYNEDDAADRVLANFVTPSFLTTLGIEPVLGRTFSLEEGRPGAARVAIVSHAFWQTRLGGDAAVLGRSIRLDGEAYQVVGVMPATLGPLETASSDVWAAMQVEPPPRKGPFYLRVVGRLKPGVSRATAVEELRRLNRDMFPEWADSYSDQRATWGAASAMDWVVGETRTAILVLFGGALFVLLIAATNVANLVVSRATVRFRELAVRAALGASRLRLAALQVTETLLVSLVGGIAGVGLAHLGVQFLTGLAPTALPRAREIGVDGSVLAFAALAAVGTGLVLGLAPGVGGRRRNLSGALRSGTRGVAGGSISRLRSALVAIQFAVALPLLLGAGLLAGSFARLLHVDPGFDPDRVLSFQVSLLPSGYPELEDTNAFWDRLSEELNALPGVDAVGLNSTRPPAELDQHNNFALAMRRTPAGESDPGAAWLAANQGYFQALGVPLISGRLHDPTGESWTELVVDQQWVRKHVPPGTDPIGLRLVSGSCTAQAEPEPPCAWETIVGVVGSVKYAGLDREDDDGAVYFGQRSSGYRSLFVFLGGDGVSADLVPQVREVVRRLDPTLAVSGVRAGPEMLTATVARPRYLMTLFGLFATLALMLAAIGIYGVMSYFVSQHTRDIGIRVALGGRKSEVIGLIVRRGLRLAVLGTLVGLAAALGLARFLEDLLFGVSARDPLTFVAVAGALTAVALLACWLPARRATRVDPMVALRTD